MQLVASLLMLFHDLYEHHVVSRIYSCACAEDGSYGDLNLQ